MVAAEGGGVLVLCFSSRSLPFQSQRKKRHLISGRPLCFVSSQPHILTHLVWEGCALCAMSCTCLYHSDGQCRERQQTEVAALKTMAG